LPFDRSPNPDSRTPTRFVRHRRARRYVIRVTDDGVVRVTIPRWGSKREAVDFVARQQPWIDQQLRRVAAVHREPIEARAAAMARAKRELPPRLRELAALHGLSVSRVSIRNQQWRWGSCSPNGHICLNWRLVTMPDWVRDYVLIHELMHLKRMDHSPKFWKLVAAACPGYENARRYLRALRTELRDCSAVQNRMGKGRFVLIALFIGALLFT